MENGVCASHDRMVQNVEELIRARGANEANITSLLSGQQEIFATLKTLQQTANENRMNISSIRNCSDTILDRMTEMCNRWTRRSEEVDELISASSQESDEKIMIVATQLNELRAENEEGMLGVARAVMRKKVGQWIIYGFLVSIILLILKHLDILESVLKIAGGK